MSDIRTVPGKVKSVVLEDLTGSGDGRPLKGWASKPNRDRGHERVIADAFKDTMPKFMENPIMLYMHNMMTPIGTWNDYNLSDEGLYLKGNIVEGVPQADYVWTLVQRRVLRALSIGFIELDGEYDKKEDTYNIKLLELFETSVVSIPMNREALITLDANGKFLGIDLVDDSLQVLRTPSEGRTYVFHAPPMEPTHKQEDETMTPEQEQKLNETHEVVMKLQTDFVALRNKATEVDERATAHAAKIDYVEKQLNDAETCIHEMVTVLAQTSGDSGESSDARSE
jgi:hypothetical protein